MSEKFPELDLEASLNRLSEWLKAARCQDHDYAEDARQYQELADRLRETAALLDQHKWTFLEDRFNESNPPFVGVNGLPVPCTVNNAGRYKGLYWGLRELAQTADELAHENPKARTKPELGYAAAYFLHLWREAGRDRPKMYDKGDAVIALNKVLRSAGFVLSLERVRGILNNAWQVFDSSHCINWEHLNDLMVFKQ